MEPPPAEFTLICIDNSKRMFWLNHVFNDQLDAIELYCAAVFKCNPNNKVCLYTMSSLQSGILVHPTSDLQQILRGLQDLRCKGGDTNFSDALAHACSIFSRSAPPNMKRRLLMFVGSRIDLVSRKSVFYGRKLKERGVALNVVNFFLLKMDTSLEGVSILSDEYHYGRDELGTLVTTVGNNNSQIVDVADEYYILDILAKSILEKNLRYLEKKAAADNEYVEAPGIQAPRIKYGNLLKTTRNEKNGVIASRRYINMFDIPGLKKMFGPDKYNDFSNAFVRPGLRLRGHNEKDKSAVDDEYGNLSKKTAHISGKENQEKAEENVSVKQESELSCNENYKAAAHGKCIEVFDKPETFCDPMRSIEQFHKEKSTSAADDECFQAPEVQYLSKVTPHPRRARKKKNQKKKPIFKQESELSCNEKNKSAADDDLSKKTTHISGKENQEKAEENVSVKQEELELSCNEKYEAAAQGIGIKVYAEMRSIEQCHKDKSTSAAYDESVQGPEIQYLSKVTPHPTRARKKKNQKKMQMFKQESELSCNEKNQVAAI